MDDRTMLELAAKAIGGIGWASHDDFLLKLSTTVSLWNPLTDDGDALRLACALTITIQFPWDEHERPLRETQCWTGAYDPVVERHNADVAAATRRAIVRAAAEIGRGMT